MPPTKRITILPWPICGIDMDMDIVGWRAPYTTSPLADRLALPDIVMAMCVDFAFKAASYATRMMSSLLSASSA